MSVCPYCNANNIVGVDVCEECGQSLIDLHLAEPATEVERAILNDRVEILEPRPVITVSPQDSVDHALKLLSTNQIGCVLVAEQSKPVGIFSERDAVLRIGGDVDQVRQRPISDFMTPKVQTLQLDAKIAFAIHMMDVGHYRHVPIVHDDGTLAGIISVRDILRYLSERMQGAAS